MKVHGKSESIESGTMYGLLHTSTGPLHEPHGVCFAEFYFRLSTIDFVPVKDITAL
jgi:hypothetical protein